MVKSKKLILICLLGFIVTACGTSPMRQDEELENNSAGARQINLLQKRIGRFNQ
jgi:hypothetical protein